MVDQQPQAVPLPQVVPFEPTKTTNKLTTTTFRVSLPVDLQTHVYINFNAIEFNATATNHTYPSPPAAQTVVAEAEAVPNKTL